MMEFLFMTGTGICRFSNSAFYTMIGYDRDSYNSLNPHDLIHPDDKDYRSRREQALVNNGFFETELRLRHKAGHYMNLSTRSVMVRSEQEKYLVHSQFRVTLQD